MQKFIIELSIATAVLSGCSANHNSIYRDLRTSAGTGALVDIKQRAIMAGERNAKTANGNQKVVCAEPSPDSLSAYAAEIAAKTDTGKGVSVELATAFQESVAFVGLRTQSIQLLRDAMYRSCEAYMNGAISESQYSVLARRYQKHAIALLAIESLTGTVKAPAVTINTSGSAGNTRPLSEITDEIARIDGKIKVEEKRITTEEDSIKTQEEKLKTEKDTKEIGKLNASISASKNNIAIAQANIVTHKNIKLGLMAGLESPQSGQVAGTAIAAVAALAESNKLSDTSATVIAKTVENIVRGITENDETAALCFESLNNQEWDEKSQKFEESKLIAFCNTFLTNANNRENTVIQFQMKKLDAAEKGDVKKLKDLQEAEKSAGKPVEPTIQTKKPDEI